MNDKRYLSLVKNLNCLERKIYEATPLGESWHISKILGELARKGHHQDHKQILRVLKELCERKLLNEPGDHEFIRARDVVLEEEDVVVTKEETMAQAKASTLTLAKSNVLEEVKKKAPTELLTELAAKARHFADEIELVAMEIEQEFQASEARSEKLKQLQTLLKGIAE